MKKSRLALIFLALLMVWGVLITRAAQLQILPNQRLAELQRRQYRTIINLPARRGSIMDRNGKELAVSIPAFSLFADPKIITDRKAFSRRLAKAMGWSWRYVSDKIKDKERRFVWLKRNMRKEEMEKIKALNLKGLGFIEESQRVYPNEKLLSQVLGFVGRDNNGLEGLELQYDQILRGESRKVKVEKDARGRPLLVEGRLFAEPPSGRDVQLTIDSELQFVLEKHLHEAVVLYRADFAQGVVMDARTFEILALGYAPTFDANRPREFHADLRRNRAVTDAFEPGSTLKTFVIAGGLRAARLLPSTKYHCENGQFKVGGHTIKEADARHRFGMLTVSEILAHSSNIGTSKIALELGDKLVRETLMDFGFGDRTGIGLPGESRGILHPLPWRPHHLANVSFGHGVAVTALQMVAAYGAIANGGVLRRPILVKAIHSTQESELETFEAPVVRRVLSRDQAEVMRMMLMEAASESGTGKAARVTGFPVAGKTGTAQKVLPGGGYSREQYISSFAGFIPANDPRFVIFVAVDNPREKYYGSEVAAPLFAKIAGYAVRKAGLAPILISEKNVIHDKSDAQKQTEALAKIRELAKVMTLEENNRTPDLKGLTLREVYARLRGTSIKVRVSGRGVVASMFPEPGNELPPNRTVRVYLEQR